MTFIQGRIEDFTSPFDVGIALHACGEASDIALENAAGRSLRAGPLLCVR